MKTRVIIYAFCLPVITVLGLFAWICNYTNARNARISTHFVEALAPTELGWTREEATQKNLFGIPPYPGWKNLRSDGEVFPEEVPTAVAKLLKKKKTQSFELFAAAPSLTCRNHSSGPEVEIFDGTEATRKANL